MKPSRLAYLESEIKQREVSLSNNKKGSNQPRCANSRSTTAKKQSANDQWRHCRKSKMSREINVKKVEQSTDNQEKD